MRGLVGSERETQSQTEGKGNVLPAVLGEASEGVQTMLSRFRDRGFYDPLSEMNRLSEQMFGGLMRPAESTQQAPIAVHV